MNRLQLTALILSICLLMPLTACGKQTMGQQDTENTEPQQTETESETESESEPETVPPVDLYEGLGRADFNDYSFRILYANEDEAKYSLMEDYMGTPVDDAIFEANQKAMDIAKVSLEPVYNANPMTALMVANKSGDLFFDLASDHDKTTASVSLQGHLLNLYRLPHINWDGEWWPQFTLDALQFCGTMMMISNYFSYRSSAATRVIFANMDMIDSYGIEKPHTLVQENRWTIDQLISMTRDTYDDVDGNGIMEKDADVYGFSNISYLYCYFEAWNIEIFDKTDDGNSLYLNVGDNIANIMEKMYSWLCESPGVFHSIASTEGNEEAMFRDKHAIFIYSGIGNMVTQLMDTDINYAILPLPKLDASVPEYYSGCMDRPFSVPSTYPQDQYDLLGFVLEALAITGYDRVYPAYVETALQYRYAPTEEDSKMVNMIFKNRILSFSYLYSEEYFPWMMNYLFNQDSFNYSSYIASNMKRNETWVQRLENKLKEFSIYNETDQ